MKALKYCVRCKQLSDQLFKESDCPARLAHLPLCVSDSEGRKDRLKDG